MSSKKRKYREKISESSGSVLDLFDHPAFRSTLPPEPVRAEDTQDDDRELDEDDVADAPAAEPRPA
jgi:hypothetical protein